MKKKLFFFSPWLEITFKPYRGYVRVTQVDNCGLVGKWAVGRTDEVDFPLVNVQLRSNK